MSKTSVVAISSSISEASKTARFLDYVTDQFDPELFEVSVINLREIPAESFFQYPSVEPALLAAFTAIDRADGIIVTTPIYKSSCSGLLKSFLDLLPQFAFAGKAILPLATGGTLAHVLALDYSLRPIVQSMGARQVVQSYFLLENDMVLDDGPVGLKPEADKCVSEAIHHFQISILSSPGDRLLGHPRPERVEAVSA